MAKRSKCKPLLFTRHASPYLYFHWRDENGRRHERSTRKRIGDEEAADAIRHAFVKDLAKGHLPSDLQTQTFGRAVESWLDHRRGRIAVGSWNSEKAITGALLRYFRKETRLKSIANINRVQAYENARLEAGINTKTINNEVLVLKGILERADLWYRVRKYKKLRVAKSDVGAALTREECKRLIAFARDASPNAVAPYAALVSLGTGLRDWEIKCLRLGDIHLDSDRPHLYVRRETTKSDAGARYAALDAIALWAMKRLISRAKLLGSSDPHHYLLPAYLPAHNRRNDPLRGTGKSFDPTHHQTCWEWDRVRKIVGIEHRRFHDLRHTYASRAGEAGVPLPVLLEQTGHVSRSTLSIYTHISGHALHDAATRLGETSGELVAELTHSVAEVEQPQAQKVSTPVETQQWTSHCRSHRSAATRRNALANVRAIERIA